MVYFSQRARLFGFSGPPRQLETPLLVYFMNFQRKEVFGGEYWFL
jgi:hypothetical protein